MSRLNSSRKRVLVVVMAVFLMTTLACGSLTFGSSPNAPGGAQAPTATRESSAPPTWPPTWTPTSSLPPATDAPTSAPAITLTPTAASTSVSIPTAQGMPGTEEDPLQDLPFFEIVDHECDLGGLIEASKECRPAEAVCSATLNIKGVFITTAARHTIEGMEADRCVYYYRVQDIDVLYSDELVQILMAEEGATLEKVRASEQELRDKNRAAIGAGEICRFGNTQDLTSALITMNETFDFVDFGAAECETLPPYQ